MGTTIAQADPRVLERAARGVPGVAFAELSSGESGTVLRLWLWDDASQEETAGRVEVVLREMGVELGTGDVRVAGVAKALAHRGTQQDEGGVRVIDLGDGTWATEPVEPEIPPLLPPPDEDEDEQIGLHDPVPVEDAPRPEERSPRGGLALAAVTVTRGRGRCIARVEIERAEGSTFAAESKGPDSATRVRRAVSEAAAAAAGAALGGVALDVEGAVLTKTDTPCALVVLCVAGDDGPVRRAAGAAVVNEDPWRAFALATLRAARAIEEL